MNFTTKPKYLCALMTVLLSVLFMVTSAFGAVGDVTISTPAAEPDQGVSFTSEVRVDVGTSVLGSFSVAFTFNKDVLQVTAIQGGNTTEFSGLPTYGNIATANTNGQVDIASFQTSMTSPKNVVSIFRVTFSVSGAPGTSSTLSMNVKDLINPNAEPISNQVIDSVVMVNNPTGKTVPTVTSTAVSSVSSTSASSGGDVTSDGGETVTDRGVCWSTSANPTTADSKTGNGTGTGSYTSFLTGLSSSTTYHVRAYATNSEGTAYGSGLSFTTSGGSSTLPTVTTLSTTAATSTSATLNGIVNPNGLNTSYFFETMSILNLTR